MVTKRILAERVRRELAGKDIARDEQIDARDVYMKLDEITNSYSALHMLPNMIQEIDNIYGTEQFIVPFTLTVTDDPGGSYTDLLTKYVKINMVRNLYGRKTQYIPIRITDLPLYANNHAGRLEGRTGFYMEGQRIRFTCRDVAIDNPKVLARVAIADSSQLDNDAPYPIPPQLEKQLIDETLQFFLVTKEIKEDEINNASDGR